MKKRLIGILLVVLSIFFAICLGGCGNTADKGNHSDNIEESGSLTEQKILIAFFSRADENYGVGTVGTLRSKCAGATVSDGFSVAELPLKTIGLKPYRK